MIRLKRVNESLDKKHHNRFSVSELEDYFIEFIDSGDIEYYHSDVDRIERTIKSYWKLTSKYNKIEDVDKVYRLSDMIRTLGDICKRWNLKFEFDLIGIGNKPGGGGPMQTQLIIIQELPQEISNYFLRDISTPTLKLNVGERKALMRTHTVYLHLKQDKEMNFYLTFESDISEKYKDSVVEQVKRLVKIPMEFVGREDISRRVPWQDEDEKTAKWLFKLLV